MKRTYLCPKCDGVLNPNVKIILRTERLGRAALLLLSPQPGNYQVIAPESFRLKKHDELQFYCPLCSADLTSARNAAMAEIAFSGPSDQRGTVVFSRVMGHHETYFVTSDEVRPYGEHAARDTLNFWGAGPRG